MSKVLIRYQSECHVYHFRLLLLFDVNVSFLLKLLLHQNHFFQVPYPTKGVQKAMHIINNLERHVYSLLSHILSQSSQINIFLGDHLPVLVTEDHSDYLLLHVDLLSENGSHFGID